MRKFPLRIQALQMARKLHQLLSVVVRGKYLNFNAHFDQRSVCKFLCLEVSWRISVFCLFATALIFASGTISLSANPQISLPASGEISNLSQSPHAFLLSEVELRDLAQALAPKVDLFREVWEKDPEAEFFAGTTRDYLYWILGHFKGVENLDASGATDAPGAAGAKTKQQKITEIKSKLLSIPFIKFNEIVGPESDADIMTKHQEALSELRAEDFAIRKLDFISFDRAVPGQPMYLDEIDQGYIPSEKIRLSKKGITTDPSFGNGVSDLVTGNLSIQFPDIQKFWQTHYAKQGSNHPLLLALRYVRILAQDYLQRHGSEIPDAQKLGSPMTEAIKKKIKDLIQEAIADSNGSFKKFLSNDQGKKWLNASIQKSFRSFTNANAAFELMNDLGILGLIEIYDKDIESVHQYLLKVQRDKSKIAENFRKFGIKPEELYEKLEDYLPDLELYHGTASELAFRNIIYQGVIPSEDGSAGRGLYGVSKKDLEFAKEWSKGKSRQDDLVIALKLKPTTKIVDITQGKGKELFEKWRRDQTEVKKKISPPHQTTSSTSRQSSGQREISSTASYSDQSIYDSFAEAFGIDLLRYPYADGLRSIEAFVLKNSEVIEQRRGVFKNPKPLSHLLNEVIALTQDNYLQFLKNFVETPLTRSEQNFVFSKIKYEMVALILKSFSDSNLTEIASLKVKVLGFIMNRFTPETGEFKKALQILIDQLPLIQGRISPEFRPLIFTLRLITKWPEQLQLELSRLIQRFSDEDLSIFLEAYRESTEEIPETLWNRIPDLLLLKNEKIVRRAVIFLGKTPEWPTKIWKGIVPFFKQNQSLGSAMLLANYLKLKKNWDNNFWRALHSFLWQPFDYPTQHELIIHELMLQTLSTRIEWPREIWDIIPHLLRSQGDVIQTEIALALSKKSKWPRRVHTTVLTSRSPHLKYLQDRNDIQIFDEDPPCINDLRNLTKIPDHP